jgi:hypothetical protein
LSVDELQHNKKVCFRLWPGLPRSLTALAVHNVGLHYVVLIDFHCCHVHTQCQLVVTMTMLQGSVTNKSQGKCQINVKLIKNMAALGLLLP